MICIFCSTLAGQAKIKIGQGRSNSSNLPEVLILKADFSEWPFNLNEAAIV
jgi:hypothetical protein